MAYNPYAFNTVPVGEFSEKLRYFTHEAKQDRSVPKNQDGKFPQKKLNGVPVWVVTATVDGKFIKVSVPLVDEPTISSLTPIAFENLVVGAIEGNLWFRADDVNLA